MRSIPDSIRSIYRVNLGIRQGEKVLVFVDRIGDESLEESEQCRRERLRDIALLSFEIGKAFTRNMVFCEYPATGSHGAEPPEELWISAFGKGVVGELKRKGLFDGLLRKEITEEQIEAAEAIISRHRRTAVDAVIGLSNYSTSHTRFRDLLTRVCGCRYASMPIFDIAMFEGPMSVDWKALSRRTRSIARTVNKAEWIEISTPNGTHIRMSKEGRIALADDGILTKPGAFGNLPAGEVFLAPVEGTAEGRLVLEWAPTRELMTPVTMIVEKGLVKEIIGDEPFAEYLRRRLDEREENRNIAEFGIGTNDRARRPDNILESEKILGSIHIALGDNSSFGGRIKTPFHQDFVFFKPTVILKSDGESKYLLKDGILSQH